MDNFRNFINNDIDEAVTKTPLPPKLHRLLRLGLTNVDELEQTRSALRIGERSINKPKKIKIKLDKLFKKL